MALEHIERRARRMRERREELDLTQEEVAARMIEVCRERYPDEPEDRTRGQMVSDWERAVNSPSPRKLELLAAALDTTVEDFARGPVSERVPAPEDTPDLLAGFNGDARDRLAATFEALAGHLASIDQRLERIERWVGITLPDDVDPADLVEREIAAAAQQRDAPRRASSGSGRGRRGRGR